MSFEYLDSYIENIYYKYYEKGLSVPKISKLINVPAKALYKSFKKMNLKMRDDSEKSIKCSYDKSYFGDIDTNDKAYWLGFIYADGYILSKRKHSNKKLGISISEKDIHHLEKFRTAISGDMNISVYSATSGYKIGTKYARIIVPGADFSEDLIRHGVLEHKSNILKRPCIKNIFCSHFIRGFFDGNGSIWKSGGKNNNHTPQYSVSFTSTDDVLDYILDCLIDNHVIVRKYNLEKRKSEQIVSSFRFGGNNNIKRFTEYIYSDSNDGNRLDRKYQKYLEFLSIINSRPY